MRRLFAVVLSFATLSGFATPAMAQTAAASPCTQWITAVPVTITSPGYYCLKQNITTNLVGGAIGIESSDVTLDCRGRSITHGDPANDAFGITGSGFGPVHDVTVRSCKLVDFGTGILFGPGSDRIEIANNDVVKPKLDGIVLWGSNSRIVGNSVLSTHNTFYDYSRNITVTAFEPGVRSTGNVISNNTIAGAFGNGTIWGIRVDMSDNALINNNQVIDLQPNEGGFAAAIVTDSATSRILNNVMMARTGTNYGNMGSAALCSRNLAVGLAVDGFEWCTQSINNTTQP
jgi:hypothetical protein